MPMCMSLYNHSDNAIYKTLHPNGNDMERQAQIYFEKMKKKVKTFNIMRRTIVLLN